MHHQLYLILPCFNEAENLPQLVSDVDCTLRNVLPYKIVAIDDGSNDGTGALLEDFKVNYPVEVLKNKVNMGLSWTLRNALSYVLPRTDENDVVITMDADNTHDVKCILSMLKCIREGAEVVVASRYVKGGSQIGVSFTRIFLSKAVNLAIRILSGLEVVDTTSGYRGYKASTLKRCLKKYECLIESKGFEAQLELLVKLNTCTSKIIEIPLILRYDQKYGKSKMHIPNTIINYIQLMFKVIVWRISK